MLNSIGKLIVGDLSPKNLSGPITIAKVAGDSARSGSDNFIRFVAILSIMLGVMNLLPVPVLDGGHLMYYLIEVIKGSGAIKYGPQTMGGVINYITAYPSDTLAGKTVIIYQKNLTYQTER